jgi:hypothetical protein
MRILERGKEGWVFGRLGHQTPRSIHTARIASADTCDPKFVRMGCDLNHNPFIV